jgi:hypothetical protein
MNREELFKLHKEVSKVALDIMKKKNNDYAGTNGDNPFANFTRTEAMGIASTEAGFLCRITDKVSRLSTFASAGELKVDNESYYDAILDIINYCILFHGYVSSKEND